MVCETRFTRVGVPADRRSRVMWLAPQLMWTGLTDHLIIWFSLSTNVHVCLNLMYNLYYEHRHDITNLVWWSKFAILQSSKNSKCKLVRYFADKVGLL